MTGTQTPCFFLVACEPSGDLLGARLMHGLRKLLGGNVRFAGVGGERMQAEGMEPIFHQSELALFGLFELLPKIPHVLHRLNQTAKAVLELKPAAVITIDGPDFNFRLAKKLKGQGIPLIHYVAPTVWAWRAGRAKKVAALYDHLLALLPFEPPYFEKEGLATTFVGHSILEQGADKGDAKAFRTMAHVPFNRKIITVLPGSRRSEIKRLAPVFGKALKLFQKKAGETFSVVVPTVPQVMNYLAPHMRHWPVKPLVVVDDKQKYDAFMASHVALAASGTVAVELALAGTPNIIAYRLHPLTAALYRKFIKVKYVNLVNLLLDRPAVPEYLQNDCTPEKLADALYDLWTKDSARDDQRQAFLEMKDSLRADAMAPSEMAARVVCRVANVSIP
jgi:lipid-A-disaccharide synthase